MRRVPRAATLVCAALIHAACLVSSLHPIYDNDSIVVDEGLLGTWENRESEVSVVVTRGEWRSYALAYTDRFGTTRFTAHMTTVGPARFLNVRPEDGLERPAFVVATNGWLQIEIEDTRVRVREPEYATVLQRLESGKLGTGAATDLKQNIIITAASPRLRAWLAGAVKDPSLWADWKTFVRSAR